MDVGFGVSQVLPRVGGSVSHRRPAHVSSPTAGAPSASERAKRPWEACSAGLREAGAAAHRSRRTATTSSIAPWFAWTSATNVPSCGPRMCPFCSSSDPILMSESTRFGLMSKATSWAPRNRIRSVLHGRSTALGRPLMCGHPLIVDANVACTKCSEMIGLRRAYVSSTGSRVRVGNWSLAVTFFESSAETVDSCDGSEQRPVLVGRGRCRTKP